MQIAAEPDIPRDASDRAKGEQANYQEQVQSSPPAQIGIRSCGSICGDGALFLPLPKTAQSGGNTGRKSDGEDMFPSDHGLVIPAKEEVDHG